MYNEKWDQPKRDIFSLSSLIEWLKTKDPEEGYEYISNTNCCLAQYFTAMGMKDAIVNPINVREGVFGTHITLPNHFNDVGHDPNNGDYTFGEALKRAEEFLAIEEKQKVMHN